ncbi:MAG: aldehyde dehydrogenase family protein [Thermoleophilia bacterium]|nr:aldehyde dehydrogenase family protein [Thermoleophilia bacterium]
MVTKTATAERLLIGGSWVRSRGESYPLYNPYDGSELAHIPMATPEEVEDAVRAASEAFAVTEVTPAHERARRLNATADFIARDREVLGRTIAAEAGKALKYALAEADRGEQTFRFAAEEAKRIQGETVPMDAGRGAENRMGFWIRVPKGPVAAISPFNFPLNLVAHKVAPALAAGNSVVLKPASATPLTAFHLGRLLVEAGFPAGSVNILTGKGSVVGDALVSDSRIAVVSFTGSPAVGRGILARAGLKRVILELGSNSAVVVAADADFAKVFPAVVNAAYANSGQVCLSVQRLYVHQSRWREFVERFLAATEALVVGDPLDPATDVGPMISQAEAERAESWIEEAVQAGAQVLVGGTRKGAVVQPTVLVGVRPEMKVMCREVFAPVVSLVPFTDLDEAFGMVNDSPYGLQAGIFTESLDTAFAAVRALRVGGIMVNDTSNYRVDHMPYGGVKGSGLGREGPHFAVEEMTDLKMVVLNL